MREETEARRLILERTPLGHTVVLPLREALGRVLARDAIATVPLPGFDNSQMDGYAVRAEEAPAGAELRVTGEQPAGVDRALSLRAREAIRIFTGAPVPKEASAVIMQEDVDLLEDGRIRVREAPQPGEFIRRKGADLCEGQKLMARGDRLTPAKLGVLASQGLSEVSVHAVPRASVVTTGDELVPPGEPLPTGGLYNSNGPMLHAVLAANGVREITSHHALDDLEQTRQILHTALENTDVCLIAGGVSVGDHDHVKEALGDLGVEGGFWKVRIKPGKPLFFGVRGSQLVFGLPGNPVSAYLTYLLFVLPALRKWEGEIVDSEVPPLPAFPARLAERISNKGDRPHYVRGWFETSKGIFHTRGLQQSHALFTLSQANALVRVDAEGVLETGAEVTAYLLP